MPFTSDAKDDALARAFFGTRWVIPLTAAPAGMPNPSKAQLHAVRFTGAPPVQILGAEWSAPSGATARQVSNSVEKLFAAVSGLSLPTTVTHWALVSTTDNLVPAPANFSNIDFIRNVDLTSRAMTYSNGNIPRFPVGTLVLEVRD